MANVNPIFPFSISGTMVSVGTANTARDGTGTMSTLYTGSVSGSRAMRIIITASGTTTAGVIRIFKNDNTNTKLFDEILVPAITPSTTIKVFNYVYKMADGFPIDYLSDASWNIRISTNNAEGFNIFMLAENYN